MPAKKRKKPASPRVVKKKHSLFSQTPFVAILILSGLVFSVVVGILIFNQNTNTVLGTQNLLAKGDDDSSGSGSGSDSSGSGSSGSGSSDSDDDNSESGSSDSGSGGSGSSGSFTPTKTEQRDSESGIRTRFEDKGDEDRTEIRLSETERIRARTKDGQTRIDITSGGVKTRLEYRDDRIIIKAETEDGTETELEDDTILKIVERLGSDQIKVATAGADSFVINRGSASAITKFPLSIDLATNTLLVSTPAGDKTVAVLPDQAVQNLLAANIVNRITARTVLDEVNTGNLSAVGQLITLGERNGAPVYEIAGISDQKFLGFIPVLIEKNAILSAQTGNIIDVEESFANRFLDLLSF